MLLARRSVSQVRPGTSSTILLECCVLWRCSSGNNDWLLSSLSGEAAPPVQGRSGLLFSVYAHLSRTAHTKGVAESYCETIVCGGTDHLKHHSIARLSVGGITSLLSCGSLLSDSLFSAMKILFCCRRMWKSK